MATKPKIDEDGNLMPLQQPNRHNVPKRKWRNWPDICQRVFNDTYHSMLPNQDLFLHPKATPHDPAHWTTTAWNAAWIAADACQTALKAISKGEGYMKAVDAPHPTNRAPTGVKPRN